MDKDRKSVCSALQLNGRYLLTDLAGKDLKYGTLVPQYEYSSFSA